MNTKTWHNIICAKKTILGILLNVLVKMVDIQERLLTTHWLRVMKSKKRKQTNKRNKRNKEAKLLQLKVLQQILTKKKVTCKTKNYCISLAFSLIIISLLIAVSICCCFIKYWAKQKHLLPYYDTSKLKEIGIKNML